MHWVQRMASSYPVFPEITLVVDGVPRRIRSLIPLSPAEIAVHARQRRRAWPIYLAAIALGIGVGMMTRPHPHRGHVAATVQGRTR